GDCAGTTPSCTVRVAGTSTVTATFSAHAPAAPRLSLSTSGTGTGTITRNPDGIGCGDGCWSYPAPTTVTLDALPDQGSTASAWRGDCTGTSPACAVQVGGTSAVGAIFDAAAPHLSLSTSGTGTGTIALNPDGISCGEGRWSYPASTTVTLDALPDQGSTFSGWQGDCTGTTSTCTVTMNDARTVVATFDRLFDLTV